jgi:hypothetical protein
MTSAEEIPNNKFQAPTKLKLVLEFGACDLEFSV